MGKNTKPMLTALMDGDKLQRLRDLASKKDVSMGWLINRLVDRLLAGDIDVMGDNSSIDISKNPIEELHIGSNEKSIEEVIEVSIDKERKRVDDLITSYRGYREITSIAIEELQVKILEVSELARNLQEEIANIKTAQRESAIEPTFPTKTLSPMEPAQTTNSDAMTWGNFHRMVGLEPPSNREKTKPNADIALEAAIDLGLTGWVFDSTKKNFRHHNPNQPEQAN